MPTVLTAPSVLGDLVKREFDRDYTRETVTLRAGTAYPMGAVLGRVTADGTYALSPAAVTVGIEGAELASAVLLNTTDATAGNTEAVVLARGPVVLADAALVLDASVDDAARRATKLAELAAHGLVARLAV